MIRILRKFFEFSGEENKKKFYWAMFLGVFVALLQAMRIPAAYAVISRLLDGTLKAGTAWLSFGIILLSVVLSSLIQMKASMLQTEAGYRAAADKRIEIAEHLRYVPMGYFNKQGLGRIASIATTTMENLANIGTRVTIVVLKGYLTTAMIILMLFFFNIYIALIALAGLGVFILLTRLMQKLTLKPSARKLAADEAMAGKVLEYVQGISEVKSFGLFDSKITEVDQALDEAAKANFALEIPAVSIVFLQNVVCKVTGVLIVLASIAFYLQGSMTLAYAVMMIICSFMIFEALDQAGSFSALLKAVDFSVDLGNDALSVPTMDIEGEEISPEHCGLAMENVEFSYDTKKIIKGVSLSIPEKTSAALVGPSGGGKTTLSKLLARFWDVDQGRVTLGGIDVRRFSYDSLIKNYAFVFQDVYLFQDTVANNIAFGMPGASREAVIEAAKKACCHDFISALPEGYDTIIGEGGASLSGGEKQRISIARAIMKDAPIIILDEATANVDPENEADLVRAVRALTEEKTVIMIAHRLKTVEHSDQIFVIAQGKIAQQGTHEDLLKEKGIYRNFIMERQKAESWTLNN